LEVNNQIENNYIDFLKGFFVFDRIVTSVVGDKTKKGDVHVFSKKNNFN